MTTEALSNKGPPSAITLGFSILTHFLLVAPVIYILVLAFGKYSLFSWHPICMSVGVSRNKIKNKKTKKKPRARATKAANRINSAPPPRLNDLSSLYVSRDAKVGLLIAEAVFSVSGEAYVASRLPRRNRVTIHWILHAAGLTVIGIGLIIIVVNKVKHNGRHFATTHSQLGLTTIVLSVLVAAFGVLANNTAWLYPRVRPVLIKIGHACGGIGMTVLLLATLINGTYTHWWPGTTTGRDLTFASLFFAGLLILLKPVLGAVSRCRVVFGPPATDT